ncbi:MAG TPA: GntR family transcriptional regulator [Syntrophomonadaceae bacterium]|nr:GntR family transcriptional regulator [Syntrophomonadaceae bacterium]
MNTTVKHSLVPSKSTNLTQRNPDDILVLVQILQEGDSLWFDIDPSLSMPIYQQLVHGVKEAVARGVLVAGDRIPTVRELASHIMINPNTIAKAYQRLEQEGIIVTMRSRGSFIAENLPASSREEGRQAIAGLLDKVMIEAFHRGVDAEEIKSLVQERLKKWEQERGSR